MEPYRSYYPHAGLVLPNTRLVAERVIVLPNGSSIDDADIAGILSVLAILGEKGSRRTRTKRVTSAEQETTSSIGEVPGLSI
jgi:hypothetical protein